MKADNPQKDSRFPDAPEPEWIRDTNSLPAGTGVGFEMNSDGEVAAVCDGELQYCGFCGKPFPVWPMEPAARHALDEHRDEITIQGQQTYQLQCVVGMTQFAQMWISGLINVRISMRRRAWQLGLARVMKPGDGPQIVDPRGKFPGSRRTN